MFVNLGVLCIFKYFNFFAQSLQDSLASLGISLSFPMLHVVLPVGISFYTFLSMSYTIDVYRRELKATRNPTDFMLYVAFFPHLVAGPIVRASILLPQCQKRRTTIPEEVANGLWLVLMGYVKKIVIADRLAQIVQWGFSKDTPAFADANSWLVLYAFAFQIYGDFSGYSDIARGVSKLMGFELVENFRAPYLVTNPASFWRHWHISLSTWLRDYLYVPLGGNRKGQFKTYRNLMTTMLLGGLWHGAGAAYVLWGAYHGFLLSCHRAWRDFGAKRFWGVFGVVGKNSRALAIEEGKASSFEGHLLTVPISISAAEGREEEVRPLSCESVAVGSVLPQPLVAENPDERIVTNKEERSPVRHLLQLKGAFFILIFFHVTCLGWLFFRAGSLPRGYDQLKFVLYYLRTLIVLPAGIHPMSGGILVLGALTLFFQWKFEAMNRFSTWPLFGQVLGVMAALSALAALGVFEGAQFIYFQF
jgi:D-alanyl-lipoteichoic acid acyltransferase DltB (MBOAT superfamily)